MIVAYIVAGLAVVAIVWSIICRNFRKARRDYLDMSRLKLRS